MANTREIKCRSGNTYICQALPYNIVIDYIRWTGVFGDKKESEKMRHSALFVISELEQEMVDIALNDKDKEKIINLPQDVIDIKNALINPPVDKKKSET